MLFYCDFHGHSTIRDVVLYGCDEAQAAAASDDPGKSWRGEMLHYALVVQRKIHISAMTHYEYSLRVLDCAMLNIYWRSLIYVWSSCVFTEATAAASDDSEDDESDSEDATANAGFNSRTCSPVEPMYSCIWFYLCGSLKLGSVVP